MVILALQGCAASLCKATCRKLHVLVLPLPTDITELQWKDHRNTYISDQGHTDKGMGGSRIWTRHVPSDMGSY